MNINLPDYTSLFWRQNRLKTFNKWPFKKSDKCNSECMASAGFYSLENPDEPDLVECFICSKQLDGWESHDDPWSEHVQHQSDCPFVKLNKQDEKKWTVEDLFNLYKKFQVNEYMREVDKNVNAIKEKAAQLRDELSSSYIISQKKKNLD